MYLSLLNGTRTKDLTHLGADPELMLMQAEAELDLLCDKTGYHSYKMMMMMTMMMMMMRHHDNAETMDRGRL